MVKKVAQPTPDEKEQLVEEMKLQWLRGELGKAEDEIRGGEGVPGEQVIAEPRERNQKFREKGDSLSMQSETLPKL